MPVLSDQQIAQHAYDAGFRGDALRDAVAIALAESRGDSDALGDLSLRNDTWGASVGLWQIRSLKAGHGNAAERVQRDHQANLDPATNARNAYAISREGENFRPWSTYTNGDYRQFQDRARTAAGQLRQGGPGNGGAASGAGAAPAAFRVTPDALTDTAQAFTRQADQLQTVQNGLNGNPLPARAFGGIPESQQAWQSHTGSLREALSLLTTQLRRTGVLANGLTNGAANYREGDQNSANGYRSLLPEDSTVRSLTNGNGGVGTAAPATAPGAFSEQIASNRTEVANALEAEQRELARLQTEQAAQHGVRRFIDGLDGHDYNDRIEDSQRRIDLYTGILNDNRKILEFDPSGNGRIVELLGDIDADTENVAVFVPGTNTSLTNFDQYATIARGFVDADPTGGLAVVVWADGEFPQNLVAAAGAGYAQEMAPDVAAFSHQLRDQIGSFSPGNDVQVTFAGHSYGGTVVGLGEQSGLDADRVLHIESAGMGRDVWDLDDLHNTQNDVQRYVMTALGDPIQISQGTQLFGLGHGADPDTFPGVTRLETGNYPDGRELDGLDAHNGVFTYHSDAWWNIYGVFTGAH